MGLKIEVEHFYKSEFMKNICSLSMTFFLFMFSGVICAQSLDEQKSFRLCPQCLEYDISNLLNELQLNFFYMDDFFDKDELVTDSVFVLKDEHRFASLLITNGFLVASYQMTFGAEEGTIIIDLNSKKYLLERAENNFYVYGFDSKSQTLLLEDSGYDDNGRFWRGGQWGFMNRTAEFGEKTY